MKQDNSMKSNFFAYFLYSEIKWIILFLGPIGIFISIKSSLLNKNKSLKDIQFEIKMLYKLLKFKFVNKYKMLLSSFLLVPFEQMK